ncbi:MAG: translocation/assembly module TamB domain-containing protein [Burkholderiaceae bacterium]|nr:translocation/assembly module TamB domain-containing protein [Burkholderiaceae bacterium]
MASEIPRPAAGANAAAPAASTGRTRRSRLAAVLFVLAALMLGAALAVVWMLATESGTRALLSLLGRQLPVEASGVRGSLIDELQFERLQLAAGDNLILIEGARLRWQPWRLRDGRLEIERMSVRKLTIVTRAGKDKAPQMPATLELPFRLSLASLQVGRLNVKRDEALLLAADDVLLSLHYDGSRHRLQLKRMRVLPQGAAALSGRLSGELDIAARPPFALAGEWQLNGAHAQGKADGTLRLDGTLAALAARFDLRVQRAALQTRLEGTASLRPFASQPFAGAQLRTRALDLATLVRGWPRTRLDASLTMDSQDRGSFSLSNTMPGPLGRERLPLVDARGEFAVAPDTLRLSSLSVNGGEFRGDIGWSRTQEGSQWQVRGRLRGLRLADWRRVAGLPEIVLHGEIDADGAATPRPRGRLAFTLDDSRVGLWPLSGAGRLRVDALAVDIDQLDLRVGANRLRADGRIDMAGGDLRFALTAPRLAQFGDGYRGSAQVEGRLSGTFAAPALAARWQADALQLPGGVAVGKAGGTLDAGSTLDTPLRVAVDGERVTVAGTTVDALRLSADGSLAQHALRIAVERGADRAQAEVRGGLDRLDENGRWQGTLDKLDMLDKHGQIALRSERPAELGIDRTSFSLRRLQLGGALGRIVIDRLARDASRLSSSGRIEALPVAPLLKKVRQDAVASTDLVLEGDWDLVLPAGGVRAASGGVRLRRRSGDLVLTGEQQIALGLSVLAVEARAAGARIALTAELQGRQLGIIGFGGSIGNIGNAGRGPIIGRDAAIDGVLSLELPSIAAVAALASPNLIAGGRIDGRMDVTGTIADPRLSGQLAGRDLRLLLVDSGFALRGGTLDATLFGNTVELRELSFISSGGSSGTGRVVLRGPVRFDEGHAAGTLDWRLERFLAFDRVDRQLQLSGQGRLVLSDGRLDLSGQATVDHGLFDIGRSDAPELSDDVVVVGKAVGKTPSAPRPLALGLDVRVALGDQIRLRGRGLDARIGGTLQLASSPGEPLSASGEVQVVRGTYRAYGRELAIERGTLRFDGPPGNPALDIRAMRREAEVAAGVSIVGTARAPRVSLVSEPQLPDAEKLSWLVLGQGLSGTSGAQVGALQSAAGALLAQGAAAGVQSQIASSLGVDSISVGRSQDNLQQRIVSVGKRVSSRLFLSYQHGLQTAGSTVLLRYILSPRITVEAETGVRSVFSLFYNFSFD